MNIDHQALFGLTNQHLVQLPNGVQVHHQAQDAFMALQQAAKAAGFDLQIASSFRDFERQKAIWNGKFCGAKTILDIDNNPVDISQLNAWQICEAILLFSALPGGSRHHWGCDFDYYDANGFEYNARGSIKSARGSKKSANLQLIDAEYQGKGPCAKLCQWLYTHAKHYGFYFPYRHYLGGIACEPWHLSYHPVAKEFEQQLNPERLKTVLFDTDIEGKNAIITHIDIIYERYINNLNDFT